MADIPESNTANIDQALNVASQIVDATTKTDTQPVTGIPEATVETGTKELKISGTSVATSETTAPVTSDTSNSDAIAAAAKKGLADLQTQQNTTSEAPVSTSSTGTTSTAYTKEVYSSNDKFTDYAGKLGYTVSNVNGKLYVNNTAVDWQNLGLTQNADGTYSGSQAQYDQLLQNVKNAGYTSGLAFKEYAGKLGYEVAQDPTTKHFMVNGKEVDFSQYTSLGMQIVKGNWVGTEAAYKQIVKDIEARSEQTLTDFLKSAGLSVQFIHGKLYINNKLVNWKSEGLKKVFANVVGTDTQYQKIADKIEQEGYSNQTLLDYAKSQGISITGISNIVQINGQLFDLNNYISLGLDKIANVGWGGTEEAYNKILEDLKARSSDTLDTYLTKQGMVVSIFGDSLYINNRKMEKSELDQYGVQTINGKVYGTQEQFNQIAMDTQASGYTSDLDFDSYAKKIGITLPATSETTTKTGTKVTTTEGKTVTKTVNVQRTTLVKQGATGDYVKQIQTLLNQQGYALSIDGIFGPKTLAAIKAYQQAKGLQVDGIVGPQTWSSLGVYDQQTSTSYEPGVTTTTPTTENITTLQTMDLGQFGLTKVDGKWVGSELQYKEAIDWIKSKSKLDLGAYLNSKTLDTRANSIISTDGKMYINGKEVSSDYAKSFGLKVVGGKLYGSTDQYNNLLTAVQEEGYTTNLNLSGYIKSGSGSIEKSGDNLVINGKLINPAKYTQYGMALVDGEWVGPETAYKKIQEDVVLQSEYNLNEYISKSGLTYELKDDKIYINGNDVTSIVNASGLELINGELHGTTAQMTATLAKIEEPYTYKSAYEEEIQNALDELKNFEGYATPQETLDLINQLIASAQEKFSYVPGEDSSLLMAQKEAERQVREGSAVKGMLYSSGTMETVTRKMAELIPTFEQKAYERFQAEQNRTINVLNAVMQWDQMQADIKMDQLTIITNKFNAILDLDNRALEQFKVLLDQRQADKQYELDTRKYNLDKQTAETNAAWDKVNGLGYVDEETSVILGIPVGTKAAWVKQIEEEQKNALANQQTQFDNDAKLQASQAAIDKALVEYKASLDAANAQKLAATEYEYNKQLAQTEAANAVKLAGGGAPKTTVIKSGSKGADVSTLQTVLNGLGYNLAVDGVYGAKTTAAVKDYQKKHGLTADGIVGAKTWASLGVTGSPGESGTAGRPTNGLTVTSGYGEYRAANSLTSAHQHAGIDIAGKWGDNVSTVFGGTVVSVVKASSSAGNYVIVKNPNGTYERFLHLSGSAVKVGQTLKAGQTIGYMGNSGTSSGGASGNSKAGGVHLHYEIRTDAGSGYAGSLNPLKYIS